MPSLIIDDSINNDVVFDPRYARGLVMRDFRLYPASMYAPPPEMILIPRSEWSARIKMQNETKSSLWHLRQTAADGQQMPTLDQNGQGFCWAYSVTRTVQYVRVVMNQPYTPLSAHSVACKVKGFRDEGGWCGLAAEFIRANGVASQSSWPAKSMSRTHDNPDTWKDASRYKITEDWVDLASPVYYQNLTFEQVASCLLQNVPCAVDFNWWSHSVCAIQLVEVEPGSFGLKIDNSWTDGWGEQGTAILRGSKALPDGAVATRVVVAT